MRYLSNENIEKLNKVLNASKSVEKLYNKLYELEINNKKDTDEYKKYIEYLKLSLEMEQRIFKNCEFTPYECSLLYSYLFQYKLPSDFVNNKESIMKQDYSNRHIRRVLIKLKKQVLNSNEEIKNQFPEDLVEFAIKVNNSDFLKIYIMLVYRINNDIYNVSL